MPDKRVQLERAVGQPEAPPELRLPDGLEAALRGRASAASDLPRLAQRLQLKVDSREQARVWLAQHGGLNFSATIRRRRAAQARATRFAALRARWASQAGQVFRPALWLDYAGGLLEFIGAEGAIPPAAWRGLGASLAGAVVGYALLSGLPSADFAPWLSPVGGLSAAAAAVLAAAALGASQWTSLRGMLRA